MHEDRTPRSGGWWIKMGLGSVALMLIASVAGLEVRREQLRGVLREAALGAPPLAVPMPRPVLFNEPTDGRWDACMRGVPGWWDEQAIPRHRIDRIIECASRRELGDVPGGYLTMSWPVRALDHAATLEPERCVQLIFAVLRSVHDEKHRQRNGYMPIYGSRHNDAIRRGVRRLPTCALDAAVRAQARDALATLEEDLPSIQPTVTALVELQRERAYRWMARTAWDYDDPFFYETSGLISRYRRQFTEYARWRSVVRVTEGATTVFDLADELPQLDELTVEISSIRSDLEHAFLLRAGRMLLDGSPENDPVTGRVMHRDGGCVHPAGSAGGAVCAAGEVLSAR